MKKKTTLDDTLDLQDSYEERQDPINLYKLREEYMTEKMNYNKYVKEFKRGIKQRARSINKTANRPWNTELWKVPTKEYNRKLKEMRAELKEYRSNGKAITDAKHEMFLKKREEYANGLNEATRRLNGMHNSLYMEVFASQIALKNADKQYKKRAGASTGMETDAQYEKTRDYLTKTINEKEDEIKKLDRCIEYVREHYLRPGLFSKPESVHSLRSTVYDISWNPAALEKVHVSVKLDSEWADSINGIMNKLFKKSL